MSNSFATPWIVAHQAPLSMGFSRQNTGVVCHFLLQGIFPTQGSSLSLLHCRKIHYWLSYQGSIFLLKLLVITLCSSSVTYWIPFELGELIFQCHIYLPFQTVRGVFQARILEWVVFPSPADHILSEHSTVMPPSWVTLHGMAHRFIELHKPLPHNKVVIHEGGNNLQSYKMGKRKKTFLVTEWAKQ